MKKIYLLFPIILILLFSACRKDLETMGTTTTTTDPAIIEDFSQVIKPITSSVDGQVHDINQRPVANATVRLGNLSTMTDEYGLFSFENVTMNEDGTFILVTQNGFLNGSRRFFPRENINNTVVIEMIPENFQSSFDGATGGTVTINGTTGVAFPANSIVDANGEVFEGEVFTTSAYLDPTANSTADRMPGNLQGIQRDLEEVSLQSFGMINVSLQDANGAPLNIREGFTATISVALPTSIAANAPNEMPLWSFNETYGVWVEEGSATKINGHYVGEVSHFSWWNCDYPYPLVELDVTLVDENGNPVEDHIVALGFESDSIACYYSYTNEDGFTSGKVPANETFLLQIRGLCGEVIYSTIIGPFTDDTSLGTITIEDSNINNTEIIGSLVDCAGNAITNGAVIVTVGDQDYLRQVDNGSFNFFISTCDGATDLTVIGIDFNELFESDPVDGVVGTVVNTGAIQVCDNPITQSIMTVTVGTETYNYVGSSLTGGVSPNGLIRIQYSPLDSLGEETFISLNPNGTTVGNYDNDNNCTMFDYSTQPDFPYSLRNVDANAQGLIFENFDVTEVSPNLIGTFSGEVVNEAGFVADTVMVSGSFTIIQ